MKNIIYLLMVVCMLYACNFSVGSRKDFKTGLSISYHGFSVEEAVLVDADNNIMSDNEVKLDSRVAIVVQGIGNYALKDDKVFPGLMLKVTDKQGAAVIDEADLFASSNGYSATDASVVRGTVTVGTPMKVGETYHVKMRLWDKTKPTNELTAEVDIKVE